MSALPNGWFEAAISDVTKPFGLTDPTKTPEKIFKYVDIGSIDNNSQTIGNFKVIKGSEAPSRARRVIHTDDTLFSTVRTYLKNIALVPEELDGQLTSTGIAVLRPNEALDPKYLFMWASSDKFVDEVSVAQDGTMYPAVSDRDVANAVIRVPPLAEQQRIVAKIDSLSAKSRRSRDQLDHIPRLVEKYKQAILAAAFRGELTREWRKDRRDCVSVEGLETQRKTAWQTLHDGGRIGGRYDPADIIDWHPDIELPSTWIWASLDQLACLVQYGTSAKTTDAARGVAVLRMGNIQDGALDLSSLKFLPDGHKEFPDLLLEKGDVLFNRTNSAELVGKSAVYLDEPKKASFASYLIRVRCSGLLPELLSGYINSAYGREWVASVVSQQVGQANVNGTKLRQLGVPVMSRDEQREIARRVEAAFGWIDRLASEATSARKLIDHLDQAVLAKAFRGELVPQDPNDEPASVLLERIRAERQATPPPRSRKRRPKASQPRKRALGQNGQS